RCWTMKSRESPALTMPSGAERPEVTRCRASSCAAAARGRKRASRSARVGMTLGLICNLKERKKTDATTQRRRNSRKTRRSSRDREGEHRPRQRRPQPRERGRRSALRRPGRRRRGQSPPQGQRRPRRSRGQAEQIVVFNPCGAKRSRFAPWSCCLLGIYEDFGIEGRVARGLYGVFELRIGGCKRSRFRL